MTLAEVEKKVDQLSSVEQQQLMAHLVSLRVQHNTVYKQKLARRLADKDPSKWVELTEVENRLESL